MDRCFLNVYGETGLQPILKRSAKVDGGTGPCDDGDDQCGQNENLKDAWGLVASAELSSLT